MDYFGIIKRSWQITWKNKYLWLFGLLVGSGGGGFNFYNGGNFNNQRNLNSRQTIDNGKDFLSDNWIWIAVIIGVLIFLVFAFIVLSIMAQGALIGSVDKIEDKKKSGIKDGFKIGAGKFWRILGIGLLLGLIALLVFAILGTPITFLFIYEMPIRGLLLLLLGLIIFIPLMVVISFTSAYAYRLAVLKDKKVVESIREGFQLFFNNMWKTILMALLLFLIGMVAGIAFFVVLLAIAVPFILIGIIAYAALQWAGVVVVAGIGLLIIFMISLFYSSVYATFQSATWTLVFREFNKSSK